MEDSEPRTFTFPRSYRLKRRRLIRTLFDREREDVGTIAVGSVRLVFRLAAPEEVGADVPLQIGFAPGRTRTAVERNRIRRLLRETYRLHQHVLTGALHGHTGVLTMMVLFRGRPEKAGAIHQDLPEAFRQLAVRLAEGLPGAG